MEKATGRSGGAFSVAVVLLLGGLYGAIEALTSLNAMKTAMADAAWISVPYRSLLGAAFFAQVFLATFLEALAVGAIFRKIAPGRQWLGTAPLGVASIVVTAFGLPFWVKLNGWLPAFRSVESIAGNLLFASIALAALLLVARMSSGPIERAAQGRRPWLLVVIVEVVFLTTLVTATNAPKLPEARPDAPADKPNIVLITIDTLRADHLSCYGYKGIGTPNIDRLASQGALYEKHVSTTSWTLPALASLMTGVHQTVHGQSDHTDAMNPAFETLPELLNDAGYATLAVVTNEYLNHPFRFDQGFDSYVFSRDPEAHHPLAGLFLFDFLFARKLERHAAENMTDRAIGMLVRLQARPFFLWVHYIDPHSPYSAWYIDRFPDYDRGYAGPLGREFNNIKGIDDGSFEPTEDDKRHIRALYDAEILYVDRHVGRLLTAIDDLKLANDTTVVLTSDHGEEFWDHGGVIHGRTLFDESVHVPMIVRSPGWISPGSRVTDVTGLLEIPPAICEAAGVKPPESFQAQSLLRHLSGGEPAPQFLDLNKDGTHRAAGIYESDRTYLDVELPEAKVWLFDWANDPKQLADQANENQEESKRLSEMLGKYKSGNDALRRSLKINRRANKIELTTEMKDELKGLGYLN
jgi:arylsulfatase A-like enzyme